jgi:choloylglycine hydrolase
MLRRLLGIICCLVLAAAPGGSQACTEFFITTDGMRLVARNMDWDQDCFSLVLNPRGLSRRPYDLQTIEQPLSWESKYGSVTFNLERYQELTADYRHLGATHGTNEHGLTVGALWLAVSRLPGPDGRPSLSEAQWVQYFLDNCRNVSEAIAQASRIKVAPFSTVATHLMLCDPSGDCAIMEYLEGNLVIHQGMPLSVTVLANDAYGENLARLRQYRGFGGEEAVPGGYRSLHRFVRAAALVRQFPRLQSLPQAIDLAFEGLEGVAGGRGSPSPTQWSVVHDLKGKILYFRTAENRRIRTLDLGKLDFSSHRPIKVLDLKANLSGEVSGHFQAYRPPEGGRGLLKKD